MNTPLPGSIISLLIRTPGPTRKQGLSTNHFRKVRLISRDGFKIQDKELVILTPKKAISSHFPCHQITVLDIEHLIIKYIKAKDNQTTTKSSDKEKLNPGEIVTFTEYYWRQKNKKCGDEKS